MCDRPYTYMYTACGPAPRLQVPTATVKVVALEGWACASQYLCLCVHKCMCTCVHVCVHMCLSVCMCMW